MRRFGRLVAPKRRGIRLTRLANAHIVQMALKKTMKKWHSRNPCSSKTKAEKGRARGH